MFNIYFMQFIQKKLWSLEMLRIRNLKMIKIIEIIMKKHKYKFENKDIENKTITQIISIKKNNKKQKFKEILNDLEKLNYLLTESEKIDINNSKIIDIFKKLNKLRNNYIREAKLLDAQISKLGSIKSPKLDSSIISKFSNLYVKEGEKVLEGKPIIFLKNNRFRVIIPGRDKFEEDAIKETEEEFEENLVGKIVSMFKKDPIKFIRTDTRKGIAIINEIKKLKEKINKINNNLKIKKRINVNEVISKLQKKIHELNRKLYQINKIRYIFKLDDINKVFKFLYSIKDKFDNNKLDQITQKDIFLLYEVIELPKINDINPLDKPKEYIDALSKDKKERKRIIETLSKIL